MRELTLGSLFDGSGGFPLGGLMAGITPIWSSEIEPFAIRVTTRRLPFVKHYGDVSSLSGAELEPVDIITFGSPCQDMSVAGRRSGLDGERSGLFYQAIRIIKEMRCATDGQYPRYAVWENVPGAFSSNGGEDFRAVLEALCSVRFEDMSVPRPARWPHAGEILADGFSLAWRVLDAQYWGVPQRRKRIYLVADFADGSAGKILFESEGLSGYSAESFRTWQRAAGNPPAGAGATGVSLIKSAGFCTEHSAASRSIGYEEEVSPTLRTETVPAALALENHGTDSRVRIEEGGTVQTLTSRMGTGGNNVPLLMEKQKTYGIGGFNSEGMKSDNPKAGFYEADTSRTLDTAGGNPGCQQGGIAVVDSVYAMSTGYYQEVNEELAPTLKARDYKDPTTIAYGLGREVYNTAEKANFTPSIEEELQPTMVSRGPGAVETGYTVRRLTPTECARLQGFPDWWCRDLGIENPTEEDLRFWADVWETHRRLVSRASKPKTEKQLRKWLANPYTEAAEYKLWGNGVALPCVFFVLSGIVYYSQVDAR